MYATRGTIKQLPEPEVRGKAVRRTFSVEYKLRILAEAEASRERGQIGALLRREGLYASTLDRWRQQQVRGALGPQKRGPKVDEQAAELRRLQRENARLQQQLRRAENIIDIQKKLAVLLGVEVSAVDEADDADDPDNKTSKTSKNTNRRVR